MSEAKSIEKEFGKNIISANYVAESKNILIPVSPKLDLGLGGGIEEGSFVIVTGPPSVGKTSTSLDFAATAQLPQYSNPDIDTTGRDVYFMSIEARLKSRDVTGIHHLNKDRLFVIQSTKERILHAEDFMDIGERLINEKPGCIVIFDSFSALCTKARRDGNIGDRFRDDTPLLLANFCKRISNVLPVNKSILIGITHRIANQGQGMSQWSEASGQKIQYQADVKIKATHPYETDWIVKEKKIGQNVNWVIDKCALNTPPGMKVESKLRYGWGLDKESELLELCGDLGIIAKAKGSNWYTMPNGEKLNGTENARTALIGNPELYNTLYTSLREMLGFK